MNTHPFASCIQIVSLSVCCSLAANQTLAQRSPETAIPAGGNSAMTGARRPAASAESMFSKVPLSFEENRGQAKAPVRFQSRGSGFSLSLMPTETVFTLRQPDGRAPGSLAGQPGAGHVGGKAARLRMRLQGAKPEAIRGEKLLPGRSNYLIGLDPTTWHTNVPNYQKVRYSSVYPGIDLVYYGDQRRLEYDFIVQPKANPACIGIQFDGSKRLTIDRHGDLVVGLASGSVRWHKPVLYQLINGARKPVHGEYALKGRDQIAFAIGRYDHDRPLVIDPVFAYSTYFGGSAADSAAAIAIDHDGSAYVCGTTSSDDLIGAAGPPGAPPTGFVAKLDPTGTHIAYSTYLGAVFGQSMAVDSTGRAYIAGFTTGNQFPSVRGAQAQSGGGLSDGFMLEINPTGTGLVYATYLGGSADDEALGVALGPDGTTYVTGYTASTNFPTANPLQAANHGGNDIFIARIDTRLSGAASLLYSTYLGGTLSDAAGGIAVDSAGRIYVTGATNSTDFPLAQPFQATKRGSGVNAFLVCLAPNGSSISYSTYLGGSTADSFARKVAVDGMRNAYIVGQTKATDFPTRKAVQPAPGGDWDAFVAEINCAAAGDASLVYSTYMGGGTPDFGNDIAVDVWGNAVAAGDTGSDIFVVKINHLGGRILYGAAFGGSGSESLGAIALDPLGYVFAAGATSSADFPVTGGVVQNHLANPAGFNDAFIFRLPTVTRFDINNDTMPDLLFQNSSTGQLEFWQMSADRVVNSGFLNPSLPGVNWKVVGSADLDGDGNTDLLLQDSGSGDLIYWQMNGVNQLGVQFITPRNPGTNWNVVGVADINRDGYADIVFQNSVTFDIFVWYMRGPTMIGGGFINPRNPGAGWNVVAVGDLNNDGQADLLFQNSNTNQVYVWFLHSDTKVSEGFLNPPDPGAGWSVAGLVDLLGKGRPQIVFQNANTGALAYWVTNGLNLLSFDTLKPNSASPGLPWKLAGAR